MTDTAIVKHQYQGFEIPQRDSDQYVSLTAMAQAEGKQVNHYLTNNQTQDYFDALSTDTGIPVSALIQVFKGGNGQQGTWAHPEIAIDFAQWVSVKFRIWANRTLRKVVETEKQGQGTQLPEFDTEKFLQLRRLAESTTDPVLRELVIKSIADLMGQDYFAIVAAQKGRSKRRYVTRKLVDIPVSAPVSTVEFDHVQDFLIHEDYVTITFHDRDFSSKAEIFAAYVRYLEKYPVAFNRMYLDATALGKRLRVLTGLPQTRIRYKGGRPYGFKGILVR